MPDGNSDLSRFGGGTYTPKPLVRREYIIQSPHTGKIAGFVGEETRRDIRVYTALRSGNHYFEKGPGYAISDSILEMLDEYDVSRVIFHEGTEEDQEDVYEFTLRQYTEGGHSIHESDLYDPDDPQTFVDLGEHKHHWERHSHALFKHGFRAACDRINWRGYEPDHPAREENQGDGDDDR